MRIVLPNINCIVDFANFENQLPIVANQIPSVPADGPCPTRDCSPLTSDFRRLVRWC